MITESSLPRTAHLHTCIRGGQVKLLTTWCAARHWVHSKHMTHPKLSTCDLWDIMRGGMSMRGQAKP